MVVFIILRALAVMYMYGERIHLAPIWVCSTESNNTIEISVSAVVELVDWFIIRSKRKSHNRIPSYKRVLEYSGSALMSVLNLSGITSTFHEENFST